MILDLALAWYLFIGFLLLLYVILDGYSLGIGILSIFFTPSQRDIIISAILPVWDGNGTWLVFAGAALYAAFPLAFSTILPALYMPLLIMVLALLFRGISLEFRLKATKTKKYWDLCFFSGSLLTTICQGIVLSKFVMGFAEFNTESKHEWLHPFILIPIIGMICGYTLLASNRLITKTEGAFQNKFYNLSRVLQYTMLLFIVLVGVFSPIVDPNLSKLWFYSPYTIYFAGVIALSLLLLLLHDNALRLKKEISPFLYGTGLFLLSFVGLVASVFPYIAPRQMTYLEAAAPHSSLLFMGVGALICILPLLAYTAYSYHVFRGKIKSPMEY